MVCKTRGRSIFEMFKFYDQLLQDYNNNVKYDIILVTGLRQILMIE